MFGCPGHRLLQKSQFCMFLSGSLRAEQKQGQKQNFSFQKILVLQFLEKGAGLLNEARHPFSAKDGMVQLSPHHPGVLEKGLILSSAVGGRCVISHL